MFFAWTDCGVCVRACVCVCVCVCVRTTCHCIVMFLTQQPVRKGPNLVMAFSILTFSQN